MYLGLKLDWRNNDFQRDKLRNWESHRKIVKEHLERILCMVMLNAINEVN